MSRSTSLVLRSLLAVGLMIGFYVLALAVSAGLLYIVYADVFLFHRIDVRLVLGCVFAAGIVLWSIVPRPDHFPAPGPELGRDQQPELYQLIDSVSAATSQTPPKEVYLIPDVNAWVAQRGGLMGFGSRRVMGLGLPLLETLGVDELRAVLAHEFGHFHGGDTMLGPWIQKTRMGILRTVHSLGDSWISLPFTGYAKLFFRITNAVSRHQEFAADALAASVAGANHIAEGLKKIERAAPAFNSYWRNEYVPALQYNVRPPLGSGFSRFLMHQEVSAGADQLLAKALQNAETDPYDSHPPLPERCAALDRLPRNDAPADARPAIALVRDVAALEADLLGTVNPELRSTRPVSWDEVPAVVWLPAWRKEVETHGRALGQATVGQAADLILAPATVGWEIQFPGELPSRERREQKARSLIACAVALALADAGWTVTGDLGDPISCRRGEEHIEPFVLLQKFANKELPTGDWVERCQRLGVSDLPLAAQNAVP